MLECNLIDFIRTQVTAATSPKYDDGEDCSEGISHVLLKHSTQRLRSVEQAKHLTAIETSEHKIKKQHVAPAKFRSVEQRRTQDNKPVGPPHMVGPCRTELQVPDDAVVRVCQEGAAISNVKRFPKATYNTNNGSGKHELHPAPCSHSHRPAPRRSLLNKALDLKGDGKCVKFSTDTKIENDGVNATLQRQEPTFHNGKRKHYKERGIGLRHNPFPKFKRRKSKKEKKGSLFALPTGSNFDTLVRSGDVHDFRIETEKKRKMGRKKKSLVGMV